MEICSEGHEEVCYEGKFCPACEMHEETKKEYDEEIEDLQQNHASIVEVLETRTRDITDERDRLATLLEEIQKDQRI